MTQSICPWCGHAGVDITRDRGRPVQLIACDTCRSVLERAGTEPGDAVVLDATGEYELVQDGPSSFRVERVSNR